LARLLLESPILAWISVQDELMAILPIHGRCTWQTLESSVHKPMHEAVEVWATAWLVAKAVEEAIEKDTHARGAYLGDDLVEAFLG
jgi:hypothetical protein